MLVHSKEIKESGKPEYYVQTVDQPSSCLKWRISPAQAKTSHKQDDSNRICKVPVLINPDLHLLDELSWFGNEYLRAGQEITCICK